MSAGSAQIPSISKWIDEKGDAVLEDEFFLREKDFPLIYSEANKLYGEMIQMEKKGEIPEKKFDKPIEQLSPKGLALICYLYSEKDKSEIQPVVASTINDFKHMIRLMADSPSDTQVTVIFQPTDRENLPLHRQKDFAHVHKTVCKLQKTVNSLEIIHMDSADEDNLHGLTCFSLCGKVLEKLTLTWRFFYQKDVDNPASYPFYTMMMTPGMDEQKILSRVQGERDINDWIPLLIKEGENIWIYGLTNQDEKTGVPFFKKSTKPELYKDIVFVRHQTKMFRNGLRAIYADIEAAGHHQSKKFTPFFRQVDEFSCGVFAIKDARSLNRDRDFFKKMVTRDEEGVNLYELPVDYLKNIQSRKFSEFILKQHGKKVVTRKGKTLAEVHAKHQVSGYVQHFSKKYRDAVIQFLMQHKDSPKTIRQCVEKYDAGKMTLERLVAVYGPPKNLVEQTAPSVSSRDVFFKPASAETAKPKESMQGHVSPQRSK